MADEPSPQDEPFAFAPIDPYALSRREAAAMQVKRFFKEATVAGEGEAYRLLLDGRPARTPARREVAVPTQAAALLLAEEWNRQGDILLPATMMFTRLANTAIDGVAHTMAEVQAEIVRYAGSDLLCYRADAPQTLVELQAEAWDPVLGWAREDLGARFILAEGVMFVQQPETTLAAVAAAVAATAGHGAEAPFRLAALHVMTTLTGSTLLGLAAARGHLTVEDAWRRAHVDEDFQIAHWGEDAEAAERRAWRWAEMRAAADLSVAIG